MSIRSRVSRSSTASSRSRRGTPTQYSWRSGHSNSPSYSLQDGGVPFAMEGELNYNHRRLRDLSSIAASDLNDTVRVSTYLEQPRLANHLVSELPVRSPPGYSGYAPGVYAGNVFGRTYAIANMHGIMHTHHQREVQGLDEPRRDHEMTPLRTSHGSSRRAMEEPMGTVRYELPRRPHSVSGGHRYPEGAKVPGYAGFVPGVASGNLIAVATPRAANQGVHPDSGKAVLQRSRVDPSWTPSAGSRVASNFSGVHQDMPYAPKPLSAGNSVASNYSGIYVQDDFSTASWDGF